MCHRLKNKSLIFKEILRCEKKNPSNLFRFCVCVYIFKPLITADFFVVVFLLEGKGRFSSLTLFSHLS